MALDRGLKALVTDRVDRSRVGRTSPILKFRFAITVLAVMGGAVWWAMAGGTKTTVLYNPGHVTAVHANFENDCAKCHDGNGKGGFLATVSDKACIQCHDGSMHHPNQLAGDAPGKFDQAKLILAVNDPARPAHNQMRSADCVACHTEHRGMPALIGADDSQCTQCHANLAQFCRAKPEGPEHVTSFNPNSHPNFGRALMKADPVDNKQRLFDPTVLRFNHRKHMGLAQFQTADACITCHATANIPAAGETQDRPPFLVAKLTADERPTSKGQWMRPVKFDQACIGCHQLELPSSVASVEVEEDGDKTNKPVTPAITGVILRHAALAEVRDQIAAEISRHLPSDSKGYAVPDTSDATKDLPPEAKWVRLNLAAIADDVATNAGKQTPAVDASAMKLPDAPTADQLTPTKLADYWATQAVFGGKNGCIECHSVAGSLPAADAAAPAATLATVPTNIPATPRHWFANSQFDHSKHTNMACVECHSTFSQPNFDRINAIADPAQKAAELRQVEETSFVNSPNQTWTEYVPGKDGQVTSRTRSCFECHHPDTATSRGVGAACISCHQFHDRTKEEPVASAGAAVNTPPVSTQPSQIAAVASR